MLREEEGASLFSGGILALWGTFLILKRVRGEEGGIGIRGNPKLARRLNYNGKRKQGRDKDNRHQGRIKLLDFL